MEKLLQKQIKRRQEPVRIILIDGTEIRGKVHLLPDYRLLDLLNSGAPERPFLAVTEAWVKMPQGEKIHLHFLAINASAIRICFPISEGAK
jgi:hypothetical protein